MLFIMKSVLLFGTLALSVAGAAPQAQSVSQNSSADHDMLPIVSGTCTSNCNQSTRTLIPSNTRYIPGFKPTKTDLPTFTSSSKSNPSTSAAPTGAEVAKGFGKAKTVTKYMAQTVYKASTATTTTTKTKTTTKTVSVVNGTAAATEYSADTSDGWSFGEAGMWFGGLAGFNVALVMVVFL